MEEVNKIIEIDMKSCIQTYPCKHYVTYENTELETRKKLFNGIEIIKMIFDNKMNLDKINPSESILFRETIIKHILRESNLKDKAIYKHFNQSEMDILKDILEYKPIQGCRNDPNLEIKNVKNIIKIDMNTCYLTYPCQHDVYYNDIDDEPQMKSFLCPHIIKMKIIFGLQMDNEFIEHFVKQITKNNGIMTTYFSPNEIEHLKKICDEIN